MLVCGGVQFDSMDQGGTGVLSYEQVRNAVCDHLHIFMYSRAVYQVAR